MTRKIIPLNRLKLRDQEVNRNANVFYVISRSWFTCAVIRIQGGLQHLWLMTRCRAAAPNNLFKLFTMNNFNKHSAVASEVLDDSFDKIQ